MRKQQIWEKLNNNPEADMFIGCLAWFIGGSIGMLAFVLMMFLAMAYL